MAIFSTLSGLFTALAQSVALVRPAPVRTSARAVRTPPRLSAAQQWDKVSGVLTAAIGSATNARELQASAAQQLDLATYALYTMFDELSAVMSEPLLREAASVHHLTPRLRRVPAQALAA